MVQWIHNGGETVLSGMGYRNGSLLVESDGHYYLYSRLTFNASDECTLIQHRVMKVTQAYGQPIELMKSKRLVKCPLLATPSLPPPCGCCWICGV